MENPQKGNAAGDEHSGGEPAKAGTDFIREIVREHNRTGRFGGRVATRFPPEPNGYLHIGHAKSICLNYGVAADFGGTFNLRMDDTNPEKEEQEYVDSIITDVRWLGARWPGQRDDDLHAGVLWGSDYFDRMYGWALELIRKGKAYVCELAAEEMSRMRGTLTAPGQESPFRNRSVEENLALFEQMRRGDFPDGSRTLRAKIDMASPNINLRDPVMYRIVHATHHNTGDTWCLYPMYDWAHGFEDSIEGITHSICTLEFENHRPLYDWFIDAVNEGRTDDGSGPWGKKIHHPQQIEFARLNLTYTVMSKRKLLELVKGCYVRGWDDPRMPTICGLRRRGVSPQSLRTFCATIGVAKVEGTVDVALLEHCVREDLNRTSPRVMAVFKPLKVIIDNFPEGEVEQLDAVNNPEDPAAGVRQVPFSRVIYIEQDDFRVDPPKKYYRLSPGQEVRLRWCYLIRCQQVIVDEQTGEIIELHCTYDPETRGGNTPDGRKVKGTIHWVSAEHAVEAEARLYDHLFANPHPDDVPEGGDFKDFLNPASLEVATCLVEPSLQTAAPGSRWQFERVGYFCVDPDSTPARLVFNRTVTLRDTWAKIEKSMKE